MDPRRATSLEKRELSPFLRLLERCAAVSDSVSAAPHRTPASIIYATVSSVLLGQINTTPEGHDVPSTCRCRSTKADLLSRSVTLSTLLWLYATISLKRNANAPSEISLPLARFSGRSSTLGGPPIPPPAPGPEEAAPPPKSCCCRDVVPETIRDAGFTLGRTDARLDPADWLLAPAAAGCPPRPTPYEADAAEPGPARGGGEAAAAAALPPPVNELSEKRLDDVDAEG